MSGPIVGLYHDAWTQIRNAPTSFRHPLTLWLKAVWYRANPRSADFMRSLLLDRYPDAVFVEADAETQLPDAEKFVLLFPDAIGLGCAWLQRAAVRRAPAGGVVVLNGRKRQFDLDAPSRRALALRRFLEWTMILECLAGAAILVATPFLFAFDFVRGRK